MLGRISALTVVFLAVLIMLFIFVGFFGFNEDIEAPVAPDADRFDDPSDRNNVADLWTIDYSASFIRFRGIESGTTFEGNWPNWTALVRFDPATIQSGELDVRIDATNVETGNDDRDEALRLSTWFDTANYPEIRYESRQFSKRAEDRFSTQGILTIREKRVPVPIDFTVSEESGRFVLDGETVLDRVALEIGTDEFADTRWINQFVTVVVHIETVAK